MSIAWHLLPLFFLTVIRAEHCAEYGCVYYSHYPRKELFLPAPPGRIPGCASEGQTFCESLDDYPARLINFLVERSTFDFSTALRDENPTIYIGSPGYDQGYKYPQIHTGQLHTQFSSGARPAPVYGPPPNSTEHSNHRYSELPQSYINPAFLEGTPGRRNMQQQTDYTDSRETLNAFESDQSTNSYSRNDKIAPRSYPRENPFLEYTKLKNARVKRQPEPSPDTVVVCPTVAHFIAPRAAVNNKGKWVYIVNLKERDDYTQLVRSEKCLNTQCSSICLIPEGYTSKCQQQYVQKRLIALDGSGNQLYTDVFVFPHGCSCHIRPI